MTLNDQQIQHLKSMLENLTVNLNGNHLLTKIEMEAMQRILKRILTSEGKKIIKTDE